MLSKHSVYMMEGLARRPPALSGSGANAIREIEGAVLRN